ncbi:MAG: hypothetical protein KDC80_26825 [Saprospiraceae bacterium]|nr:hypothetical protein [Saprospiraceae bacterium]
MIKLMVEEGFEILLTVDKGIPYQQNIKNYPIQIALVYTRDNRLKTLIPKIELIEAALKQKKGKLIEIDLK